MGASTACWCFHLLQAACWHLEQLTTKRPITVVISAQPPPYTTRACRSPVTPRHGHLSSGLLIIPLSDLWAAPRSLLPDKVLISLMLRQPTHIWRRTVMMTNDSVHVVEMSMLHCSFRPVRTISTPEGRRSV